MNRFIKKTAAGFLTLAVTAAVFAGQTLLAFAATGKITFSDPSVTVGNQVSVTMKINTEDGNLGNSDVMVEYDSSALEFVSGTNANGGAGQIRVVGSMESANQTTFSFTLKFKALKAGNTQLKIASQEVYDADSQMVSISHVGNSTVKVSAASTASNDASLSALTISPGELSPSFSPDVTEYTATVAGVDSIAVSAPANDSKASVSVSGNDSIQMGENTVVCKVTAEDGQTTKSYTIKVTKVEGEAMPTEGITEQEPGSVEVSADTGNWTVSETFDASLPAGFTATEVDYNGTQVQAGVDGSGNILIYMTDEEGNGDFFILDQENGAVAPYVTVLMAEKTVIVLPPSAMPEGSTIPEGFVACTIDIGNHTVNGWIWGADAEAPEYCVVYGMNENGDRNLYRYDQKEMTLQRYFQDPAAEELNAKYKALGEEFNSLVDDYDLRGIIIAVLFGVCIVLVILVVVLLLRKPKNSYDGGNDRKPEGRRGRKGDSRSDRFDRDDRSARSDRSDRTGRIEAERVSSRRPGGGRTDRGYEEELEIEELDLDDEIPVTRPVRRPAGRPASREEAAAKEPQTRSQGAKAPAGRQPAPARNVADMEKNLRADLAKETRNQEEPEDGDDFEFIELDL